MEQKKLADFTTVELKALVYDLNTEVYQKQQAIEILNKEIGGRSLPPQGNGKPEVAEENPVADKEVTSETTGSGSEEKKD